MEFTINFEVIFKEIPEIFYNNLEIINLKKLKKNSSFEVKRDQINLNT